MDVYRVSRRLGPVLLLALAATSLGACSMAGAGRLSVAACPALRPAASALDASFDPNAAVNAKLRAFVQAANDKIYELSASTAPKVKVARPPSRRR